MHLASITGKYETDKEHSGKSHEIDYCLREHYLHEKFDITKIDLSSHFTGAQ